MSTTQIDKLNKHPADIYFSLKLTVFCQCCLQPLARDELFLLSISVLGSRNVVKDPFMRIPDTKLFMSQLSPIAREQLLPELKLGQILQARVLSENLNGNIKLQIGNSKVIAQTQLAATPGQTLTLQVDKTGPLPELKLLALTSMQEIQTQAIKSVLPRQRPLSELFANLLDFNRSPESNAASRETKQAIQSLISRLLSTEHPKFTE